MGRGFASGREGVNGRFRELATSLQRRRVTGASTTADDAAFTLHLSGLSARRQLVKAQGRGPNREGRTINVRRCLQRGFTTFSLRKAPRLRRSTGTVGGKRQPAPVKPKPVKCELLFYASARKPDAPNRRRHLTAHRSRLSASERRAKICFDVRQSNPSWEPKPKYPRGSSQHVAALRPVERLSDATGCRERIQLGERGTFEKIDCRQLGRGP